MLVTSQAVAGGEITHTHARVLARVIEFWLRHNDPDGAEPGEEGGRNRFFLSQTLEGRLKGNFDLGGDLAVTVKMAIDGIDSELLRADKDKREVDPTDPGLVLHTTVDTLAENGDPTDWMLAAPSRPGPRPSRSTWLDPRGAQRRRGHWRVSVSRLSP